MKITVVQQVVKVSLIAAVILAGGVAQAQSSNSVQTHLKSITALVRSCVEQPYTFKADGTKMYSELVSHCLYVTIVQKGEAKIELSNRAYDAQITESTDSDGDFYDVKIVDLNTHDEYTMPQVLAYGDVLLGVLQGDTHDVPEVLEGGSQPIIVPNPEVTSL
jgi:hypothetical protein